jgi:hypothetical protein
MRMAMPLFSIPQPIVRPGERKLTRGAGAWSETSTVAGARSGVPEPDRPLFTRGWAYWPRGAMRNERPEHPPGLSLLAAAG